MKQLTTLLLLLIMAFSASAKGWTIKEPNSSTPQLDYAAQCVNRLCPAPMWNSWTFEKMAYDEKANTVVFTMRLKSWREKKREETQEDVNQMAKWIVENFMEGYNEVAKTAEVFVDGDWMLYLSLGSVICKAANDGASLSIILLKPNGSRVSKNEMIISATTMKQIIESSK